MTTQAWNTVVQQTTDAEFRAWGSEFSAKLAACGMVQTADTGQINWSTVLRPAVNAFAGYEIWYLNDSLHATAPIYLRFDYGAWSSQTMPRIKVTVGTGTNGAGTLTGTALTASNNTQQGSGAIPVAGTNYQSYMVRNEGFFAFAWKYPPPSSTAANAFSAFFAVCRSCDATGAPTATGAVVYWGAGSYQATSGWQCLRFAATATAYQLQTSYTIAGYCSVTNSPSSSSINGTDLQTYLNFMVTPQVIPTFGVCTVLASELGMGVTFSTTLVGTTPRTYIAMHINTMPASVQASQTHALAILWE